MLESSKQSGMVIMGCETTIYILDCSGSMATPLHGYTSKLMVAKRALKRFISARTESNNRAEKLIRDTVSLLTFPAANDDQCELLFSTAAPSQSTLKKIDTITVSGSTPLHSALKKAAALAEIAEGLVRVVIISDGVPDFKEVALEQARILANDVGAVIDTFGIGKKDTCGFDYDEAFLRELAALGEGEFIAVDNADILEGKLLEYESERRALIGEGLLLLGDGS